MESILIDGQPGKKFYFEFTQTDFRVRRGDAILGRGKWADVSSFEVDQIGQNFMRLRVLDGQIRLISVNLPLPEHSLGASKVLEILDHKIPAAKERKFRLLKPGLPFKITPLVCHLAIWGGLASALSPLVGIAGLLAINTIQKVPQLSAYINDALDLMMLSVPFGIVVSIVGIVSLRTLRKPSNEEEGKEPIVFSRQSKFSRNKLAYILQLVGESCGIAIGSAYVIGFALFVLRFFSLTTFLALVPLLTILYVVLRLRSKDFESVVVTEGRIIVSKGSKTLANCYLSDCELKAHPKRKKMLQLTSDGKVTNVYNHEVAGETLLDVVQSLKAGQKYTPILSEDHPGFRIRFNDEQPPGV